METKILKPTKESFILASNLLKKGELVGMPTETVYGLGANAFNDNAIDKIFIAKNRPQDNPLIVHVHKDYDLNSLVELNTLAQKLIKHFTPGPLTLICKSKQTVSKKVSAGLDTLAIRIPNHKVAQKLLKECNLPIAAPSANISTRMSATTAQEVKEELNGKLQVIIDGGKCQVGIESTVLDITGEVPIILRPGIITKQQLEKVVGKVLEKTKLTEGQKVLSPGMKYKHYSPSVPVFVGEKDKPQDVLNEYKNQVAQNNNPVILCQNTDKNLFKGTNTIFIGKNSTLVAKKLYTTLRIAEKMYNYIFIYISSDDEISKSVMNRILKMNTQNKNL